MATSRTLPYLIAAIFLAASASSQSEDRYTDETRPYKFGFNIEGYQHRQEEKNEKGLIKGEYGFITADGYYRVTVYATDENGDFRIISMKNIYVGFPPEDPTTTPQPSSRGREPKAPGFSPLAGPGSRGRGHQEPEESPQRKPGRQPVETIGLKACSNCLVPTTKKSRPQSFGDRVENARGNFGGNDGGVRGGSSGSGGSGRPRGDSRPTYPTPGGREEQGQVPGGRGRTSKEQGRVPVGKGRTRVLEGSGLQRGKLSNDLRGATPHGELPVRRTDADKSSVGIGGGSPQIGTVRDGLPRGVTVDDIKALLYRFNYTVGFHGHHEDGYRNGDKEGDYFFDGRDGVERRVEYVANEFGYQPNITFVDLPENDARRPNELTEKEYGLKGYEFKWFYRR